VGLPLRPFLAFPAHLVSGVAKGPFGLVRLLLLLALAPLLLSLWLTHLVALLLDELWYPEYRATPVHEPLFIVGMPRSGTSALQEVLADDPRHTTLRLWELVLAPAICQRRFFRGVFRMDAAVGAPLRRMKEGVERLAFRFMEDIHPLRLDAPEEDYLLLAPIFACFLLVLPFPRSERVWSLTRIDDWPEPRRRAVVAVYRAMVQRHLYQAPGGVRLLSKNPMFTPLVRTLAEAFPDARVIGCVRHPVEVVPSLLSSLSDGARIFGWDPADPAYRDRFLTMLHDFGERMLSHEADATIRFEFLRLEDARRDLPTSVESIYSSFGWSVDPDFRAALIARAAASRSHSSGHRYHVGDFGLDARTVESRFETLMTRFQFDTP